ncbi:hypothetical protein LZC95_51945 [Pendulispora brunnea]|uniref:Uncharacterized protein n=1 Tax=Pendulispora brunnea TaxID=2905690 RepID=A0ABZ2KA21_9BACT
MNRKSSSALPPQPPLAQETQPVRFVLEPRARGERSGAMPVPLFLAAAPSSQGLEWRYG